LTRHDFSQAVGARTPNVRTILVEVGWQLKKYICTA
jgi:hypothetical protein